MSSSLLSITLLSYKLLSDDKQYIEILKNIEKQLNDSIDILCLQGITPEFVRMMVAIINDKNANEPQRYWLVLNPTKYGQGVIINISKFSYRMIPYAGEEQVQTLLIHEHRTSKVFYLANIDLPIQTNETNKTNETNETNQLNISKKIIKTFQDYSREQKATLIIGIHGKNAVDLEKLKITSYKDDHIIYSPDFTINSMTSKKTTTYNLVDYIIQLKGTGLHEFLHSQQDKQ